MRWRTNIYIDFYESNFTTTRYTHAVGSAPEANHRRAAAREARAKRWRGGRSAWAERLRCLRMCVRVWPGLVDFEAWMRHALRSRSRRRWRMGLSGTQAAAGGLARAGMQLNHCTWQLLGGEHGGVRGSSLRFSQPHERPARVRRPCRWPTPPTPAGAGQDGQANPFQPVPTSRTNRFPCQSRAGPGIQVGKSSQVENAEAGGSSRLCCCCPCPWGSGHAWCDTAAHTGCRRGRGTRC